MSPSVDFYREVDLVKESVIPEQDGVVISSDAKEAAISSNYDLKPVSGKALKLVGDNELVDGISVRYPGYLAGFFHNMRLKLVNTIDKVTNVIDEKSSIYYRHESRITSTISNLHSDPREELLPGFTYIAIASMTGSIFSKNRGLLLRVATPLALGAACFGYVLPKTFRNTVGLLHSIEAEKFPTMVARQDAALLKAEQLSCKTAHALNKSAQALSSSVYKAQHYVKKWTGLNVID